MVHFSVFVFLLSFGMSPSVSYIIFGGRLDGCYFTVEKDAFLAASKILGECVNSTAKTTTFVDCVSKCHLEKNEVFTEEGNYNGRQVRMFYMNQTNATNAQIDKLLTMYSACKTEVDNSITALKMNGEALGICKFYGLFSSCVMSKHLNAINHSKGSPPSKEC